MSWAVYLGWIVWVVCVWKEKGVMSVCVSVYFIKGGN